VRFELRNSKYSDNKRRSFASLEGRLFAQDDKEAALRMNKVQILRFAQDDNLDSYACTLFGIRP
jgi:hypothetical protein